MDHLLVLGDESYRTMQLAHEGLRKGQLITFVGIGRSMEPLIPDQTRVLCRPLKAGERPQVGQTVFVKTKHGHFIYHLILDRNRRSTRFLIGSPNGFRNGWVHLRNIHGIHVHNIGTRGGDCATDSGNDVARNCDTKPQSMSAVWKKEGGEVLCETQERTFPSVSLL